MTAARINKTWRQISTIKHKKDGAWVDHTSLYARSENSWHEVDLNAEQKDPAYHVWKAYADDENGTGISLDPTDKDYIGFLTGQTTSVVDIEDESIFDWSLVKGATGETGVGTVDEIKDVTGWEELPASGADVTDYSAISLTARAYVDGDFFGSLSETLTGLSSTNFTEEVSGLLDQVSGVSSLGDLPTVLTEVIGSLSTVRLDEASIIGIQDEYQQLGLDVLNSNGDTTTAFNNLTAKMAETDEFVLEINEQLGTLIVEGNSVSYSQFTNYSLLVDSINGTLESTVNQISNTDTGLVAAHSRIDQTIRHDDWAGYQ